MSLLDLQLIFFLVIIIKHDLNVSLNRGTFRSSLPPPRHSSLATAVLLPRVLQGLLMLKAISPHLDKVNVCFDFANGGVVMGLSGRSLWGLMVLSW